MADFKTADICGASPNLNNVLEKMDSLKNSLSSNLTVDPSALSSTLSTQGSSLSSSLSGMIPELPSAPDVSLQAELTGLSNIDLSLPTGVLDYNAKLASIKSQFGDSLTNSGFSLDDLVSQVAPLDIPSVDTLTGNLDLSASASSLINDTISQASAVASSLSSSVSGGASVDICSVVPNFKLPDGATEAVESAAETLMADAPGVAEKVAEVSSSPAVASIQGDLKKVVDAISNGTAYTKASKPVEIKTKDISQESIKVVRVKDNLTTKEETNAQGQTVTVRERPRTVDTAVAEGFEDAEQVAYFYINVLDAPSTDSFYQYWYNKDALGRPFRKDDGLQNKDGSKVSGILLYHGTFITITPTKLMVKFPREIQEIVATTLYPNDEPTYPDDYVTLTPDQYTLTRGPRTLDSFVTIPEGRKFAQIGIQYMQGKRYNPNYKDETREALTS